MPIIIFNEPVFFTDEMKARGMAAAGFRGFRGPFPAPGCYFWLSAACAAARRAMGTRKGEQLT